MKFSAELEEMKIKILEYYQMSFDNDEEGYSLNKSLKEKLGNLISKCNNEAEVITVLTVLAESTGCAEDLEIAENILDNLQNEGLINDKLIGLFYKNASTRRWF